MTKLFEIDAAVVLPGRGLLLTGLGPKTESLLGRVPSSVVVRWLDGVETRVPVLAYEETEPLPGKKTYELLVPEHAGLTRRVRGGAVFSEDE